MKPIDLRSDTVTRPTAAMRAAMAQAELGDDVYGEDPSVNRLQEVAAQRLGKEAALFFPSGTMANQAAIRASTRHGDVVLASEAAHVLRSEAGAAAALSGVQIRTLGSDGLLTARDVHAAIEPRDAHHAPATLLAIENTHNAAGGRVFPLAQCLEAVSAAREHGLGAHLDGARLFNAEIASGVPAARWAEPFDTVSFCLSKGLGAPVGSLVCGSRDTIRRVHRVRKMLGGGMRQAGVLAAAGLYALEHHVARLAEDHANARHLAAGLADLGLAVEVPPETNIVMFGVAEESTMNLVAALRARSLLINPMSPGRMRAVTHLDVSRADIDQALQRMRDALADLGSAPLAARSMG